MSMDKRRLGLVLTLIAAVLFMATTYMAIFYAPLPGTSVKSADAILSSVEGSTIKVSGFVTNWTMHPPDALDVPTAFTFSLADFEDYSRYLAAVESGNLSEQWWTIRPIDVGYSMGGWVPPPHLNFTIHNCSNISVTARVVASVIGPNSAVTGYRLTILKNVESGPQGGFSAMTAPIAQKIFYFHMPSAWVSYVAFFVTLVASILFLRSKDMKYDRLAMSSAELGVLFSTIAIATGPIWAKQEWGVYWRWDDTKLVTTFIMWLVYIGYLSLRAAMSEPSARARVGAVYGILGFVTMPMSLLSARIAPLLRSSHPEVIASSSGSLSPEAGLTIGVAVIAFTVLFAAMLIKRVEVAEAEEEIEELKRAIGGEE
jgi:heme exporter protein C